MNKLLKKLLYKIYFQEILTTFKVKFKIDLKVNRVNKFLDALRGMDYENNEVLCLATDYFDRKYSSFYKACYLLIQQIVLEPSSSNLPNFIHDTGYNDIPLLIKIAHTFGRFDLGLDLMVIYSHSLKLAATKKNGSRKDKVYYFIQQKFFGVDFFPVDYEASSIKVPFYLKHIHENVVAFIKYDDPNNGYDFNYAKQIKGKKIAILAPGLLSYEQSLIQELKNFDEIIPLNYSNTQFENFPLAVRISYYGNNGYSNLIKKDPYDLNLEIYCLKTNLQSTVGYRQIFNEPYKWFSGSPNMGQRTINDLLHHGASNIKVFGMNFYLAEKIYNKSYINSVSLFHDNNLNYDLLREGLAHHNPISNFIYTRNLYRQNLIDFDKNAISIIDSGTRVYAKEMTAKYSIFK